MSNPIRTTAISSGRLYPALAFAVFAALLIGATQAIDAAPGAQAKTSRNWRPPGCPPPPETVKGPSSITVTGPCGFTQTGTAAECNAEGDDFLVTVVRRGKNGAEVMLYINVERFVGPRTYKAPNDMWVGVKIGSKIYRWSTNNYIATVGPGSKSVTFKDVKLEPEPVLVGCTGPQNNYQCDGRGDEPDHDASMTYASGTIYCKTVRTRAP